MADRTGIEWTESTWNPVVGCSLVSPGCTNCYAMRLAGRIVRMNPGSHYGGTVKDTKAGAVWTGVINPAPEHILTEPLRWRRPRYVFVNSMSDLFHEGVPDDLIDRVFAVMALAPQHTFQILTKRPERMRAYLSMARAHPVGLAALDQTMRCHIENPSSAVGQGIKLQGDIAHLSVWPLPNVWLGVSAEDQRRADERIPLLLDTPAAVRWVSAEPLLGPIDFTMIPTGGRVGEHVICGDALRGPPDMESGERLDWIVAGGESGRGARPVHPEWLRSIRDQCAEAEVPFLFKQWGGWAHSEQVPAPVPGPSFFDAEGRPAGDGWHFWTDGDRGADASVRVGKKRAGRHLDGVLHDAYPQSGEIPFQP